MTVAILVMNAAGANSVSVAEHALALMLSLARSIPAADASMKRGDWEKKKLTGTELRGKTLGIVGFGRIGREVATRARAFGMDILAHDPFISARAAEAAGVPLVALEDVLAQSDFLTLHVPALDETRQMLNAKTLARCRRGMRIVNTARGELIDEAALADAIEAGQVGGAALDVFEAEPPTDPRLTSLPQVIATPHIAASTTEAQEQVGVEIALSVRDYLSEGLVRNAVNFPSVAPEDFPRVRPYLRLAGDAWLGGRAVAPWQSRVDRHSLLRTAHQPTRRRHRHRRASPARCRRSWTTGVTPVNAARARRHSAASRSSSRAAADRATSCNIISVKLRGGGRERWVEGTVFEPESPRLCTLDGVADRGAARQAR